MNKNADARSKLPRVITVMGIAVVGGIFASRAGAVIINPGQTLTPAGNGAYSGTLIDDETHTIAASFLATVHSQVYQQSNGWLDFVYQFTNTAAGGDGIETIALGSFNDLFTNADYQVGTGDTAPSVPGDVAPTQVQRSPLTTSSADTINFYFPNYVEPGMTSDLLVIQTHATSFYEGNVSLLDSVGGNAQAPVPVPEPATAALLTTGLFGLMYRPGRKRNRI